MNIEYKETKINFELQGNGDNLVVFLHGWGAGHELMQPLADLFDKQLFTLLLLDFPPFKDSEEPKTVWTMFDYLNLTKKVLNFVNYSSFNSVSVIGHSFGGRVGILLASDEEILINKLILISSAGIKPRRNLKYYFKVYRYKLLRRLKSNKTEHLGSTDYQSLSKIMKETFKNIVNTDLTSNCTKIKTKTLIIFGDKDKETPMYMAKKLNKKIKNSQLIILKNYGHFAYLDCLNSVFNYIINFIII